MIAFSLPVLIKGLEEDSEVGYFGSSKLLGQVLRLPGSPTRHQRLSAWPLALSLWLEGHAWVVSCDERLVALRLWERPGTLPGES